EQVARPVEVGDRLPPELARVDPRRVGVDDAGRDRRKEPVARQRPGAPPGGGRARTDEGRRRGQGLAFAARIASNSRGYIPRLSTTSLRLAELLSMSCSASISSISRAIGHRSSNNRFSRCSSTSLRLLPENSVRYAANTSFAAPPSAVARSATGVSARVFSIA